MKSSSRYIKTTTFIGANSYTGLGVRYDGGKIFYETGVHTAAIAFGSKLYRDLPFKDRVISDKLSIGGFQFLFPFKVGVKTDLIQKIPFKFRYRNHNIEVYNKDKPIDSFLSKVKMECVLGVSINKTEKIRFSHGDPYFYWFDNSLRYYVSTEPYGIIKNIWGVSLQGEVRFQFVKKGKDRFLIGLLYNQGLIKFFDTHVKYESVKGSGDFDQQSDNFSRGTFVSAYLSYPITILNKKEKRLEEGRAR